VVQDEVGAEKPEFGESDLENARGQWVTARLQFKKKKTFLYIPSKIEFCHKALRHTFKGWNSQNPKSKS